MGEREEIQLLLREIDNLEPISPYGLCEIDRSLITSMISTSVTYLIILIQFKQSAWTKPIIVLTESTQKLDYQNPLS